MDNYLEQVQGQALVQFNNLCLLINNKLLIQVYQNLIDKQQSIDNRLEIEQ